MSRMHEIFLKMKELLKSLKLNAENMLSVSELFNIRGGVPACNVETCFNCVWTAVGQNGNGGACAQSCGCNNCGCWVQCAQNITGQCFAHFSSASVGCYCQE